MARLPTVGGDSGDWGTVLNQYLEVNHNSDGTTKKEYTVYNIKDYGAVGNGSTDDSGAINAAIVAANAAGGGTVFIPSGTFAVASGIALLYGVSIQLTGQSVIKATAAMNAVIASAIGTGLKYGSITGETNSIIDGNGLANWAIYIPFFNHFQIKFLIARNGLSGNIKIGDSGTSSSSFEGLLMGVATDYAIDGNSTAVPSGSVAILLENCTDSHLVDVYPSGGQVGLRLTDGGNHDLWGVHAYNHSVGGVNNPMDTCFDINAWQIRLVACHADTPTTYGYRIRAGDVTFVACETFMSAALGSDNVAIGYQVDAGGTGAQFFGNQTTGGDSSHRFARDYAGTLTSSNIIAPRSTQTVVVNGQQLVNTMASNLMFVDNTYDIGANGLTRPRSMYLANRLSVGGRGFFDAATSAPNTSDGDWSNGKWSTWREEAQYNLKVAQKFTSGVAYTGSIALVQKTGTAQIASSGTTVVVTHGLAGSDSTGITPTRVLVTPRTNPGSVWWVSNLTSTQFTINLASGAPTAVDFDWIARAGDA